MHLLSKEFNKTFYSTQCKYNFKYKYNVLGCIELPADTRTPGVPGCYITMSISSKSGFLCSDKQAVMCNGMENAFHTFAIDTHSSASTYTLKVSQIEVLNFLQY